jgi:hypothetical protein
MMQILDPIQGLSNSLISLARIKEVHILIMVILEEEVVEAMAEEGEEKKEVHSSLTHTLVTTTLVLVMTTLTYLTNCAECIIWI